MRHSRRSTQCLGKAQQWTDLSLSDISKTSKADHDPLLTRDMLAAAVHNHLRQTKRSDGCIRNANAAA